MFIGRTRELKAMERLYASGKFEFLVMYGRRRVGKTALITQFIKDKRAIYFMGVESNAKQNLENLSQSIVEYQTGHITDTSFLSFQAALEVVFQLSTQQRLVLVIDEYPYVARSSRSLASTLQLLIDTYKDTSQLILILCGSSMSYMEDHVLAYKAPLCGRRTVQMKIQPFDFAETCQYLVLENRKNPKIEPMVEGYSGFLFLDKNGRPMVALHWEKYFQHIREKYNKIYKIQMPKVTPHVCRHTFCSNMAKSGMNPKTLQYIMGHSDIAVTLNVYTHLGFEDAEEEMLKVADETSMKSTTHRKRCVS